MRTTLSTLLLCCLAVVSPSTSLFSSERLYKEQKLVKNISIRLLKRDWKPLGPSAATEDAMDEYRWDVDTAFNALFKSSWTYESAKVTDAESLFKSDHFKKDQESIVIVHPIFSSADTNFVKTTVTALAMRNLHKKYNIFATDMPWNNPHMMFSVFLSSIGKRAHFEPMGKAVARFLVDGVDKGYIRPEQINLLGWSYSGQLVGYMARHLNNKYSKKINSVVSLDPFYSESDKDMIHVSQNDAHLVHIFHTNSQKAGTRRRLGTADFVFNNGIIQPECRSPGVLENAHVCSHLKVVQRFWYVILYPSKFVGLKCSAWNSMKDCLCDGNDKTVIRYPLVQDLKIEGLYHLRTLAHRPYGVGDWGVSCTSEKRLYREFKKEN
ncbi:phospholipase A1 1-like [Macrosteles quadrilineatus]|uniref:phospholipase A1 1-like n=1 Tax=Macrosteles quadrilineatus TaxID=74068 RepID=UPI0023E16738|nr:phospholipase A1 1-like [Macrosteles quadrilineatus]